MRRVRTMRQQLRGKEFLPWYRFYRVGIHPNACCSFDNMAPFLGVRLHLVCGVNGLCEQRNC